MNCPTCGAPLHQKNRFRLLATGLGFLAAALWLILALHMVLFILAGLFLTVVGIYFVAWAVKAKGLWCRVCKRVPRAQTL